MKKYMLTHIPFLNINCPRFRYFLFLLVNVVFIFLLASTYWQLVRDLANSPAKIPEKLAQALQQGRARCVILPKYTLLLIVSQAFLLVLCHSSR